MITRIPIPARWLEPLNTLQNLAKQNNNQKETEIFPSLFFSKTIAPCCPEQNHIMKPGIKTYHQETIRVFFCKTSKLYNWNLKIIDNGITISVTISFLQPFAATSAQESYHDLSE